MCLSSSASARLPIPLRPAGRAGTFVALLALAALSACSGLAPRPVAPNVEVPPAWSSAQEPAAAASLALAGWWKSFRDPLLDDLVAQALQANIRVGTARAALLQARALRDVAAAALWPSLAGSASAQRGIAGGHSTGNQFQGGLNAAWVPDAFGANRSAFDASEATALASAASLGDAQVQIAAEVGLDYILLRGAQARLSIASDNLASQLETLQITLWRQQAGLVTVLDVDQARAAAEQTRALVPALQISIDQAGHALSVLTGRPPAALSAQLAAPGPVPELAGDPLQAIPAETLRQRADVRAAEHAVSAAAARVSQADAARLPSLSIGGSLGFEALSLGALTNGTALVGSVLAGVSLPVFDAGSARAGVRVQQAAFDQAALAYQAAVLGALQQVEDALVALHGDRLRLLSLGSAAEAATAAAALARQRYGSGLVDFQTVLDTQRTQLGTQDSLASARADLGSDQVRLFAALGGGWRDDAASGMPAPPPDSTRNALP